MSLKRFNTSRRLDPVFELSRGVACYQLGGEFYVYRGIKLIRVCHSIGMAREVAAGAWVDAG